MSSFIFYLKEARWKWIRQGRRRTEAGRGIQTEDRGGIHLSRTIFLVTRQQYFYQINTGRHPQMTKGQLDPENEYLHFHQGSTSLIQSLQV